MEKKVTKWKPTNAFDLRALEAWYEEMARDGWHVCEWAYPFAATFRMGVGCEAQYRFAQVWAKEETETLAAYRKLGWEEVPTALKRTGKLRLFRANAGAAAFERDEDLLRSGLKERLGKAWLQVPVCAVLMGVLLLWGSEWLGPVHFAVAKLPILLVCLVVLAGLVVRNLSWTLACGRTMRALAEVPTGEAAELALERREQPAKMRGNSGWRSARQKRLIGYGVWLVTFVAAGVLWFVQEGMGGKVERAVMPEVPYVRLAEMRGEPLYPYYEGSDFVMGLGVGLHRHFMDFSQEEVNAIRRGWSPLGEWFRENESDCEVYRDSVSSGFSRGKHNMQTQVTFLVSEGLATQFFQEEAAYHRKEWPTEPLELAGADEVLHFYREGYETQIMLVRRGAAVASYVTDDVSVNLADHLKEMIARLE